MSEPNRHARFESPSFADWMCPHEHRRFPEWSPDCGYRACWARWWILFGGPGVLLVLAIVILGATVWGDPMTCSPGFEPESANVCVRR